MATFWKKSMVWLGLEDEGADEYQAAPGLPPLGEPVPGTALPPEPGTAPPTGVVGEALAEPESGSLFEQSGTVRTVQPSAAPVSIPESGVRTIPGGSASVHVVEATGFNDAQEVGERFRSSQPVIMNLTLVDRDTARRLVDFASGLTFALRGSMQKVGEQVFLIMPANAVVSTEEKQRLKERGIEL